MDRRQIEVDEEAEARINEMYCQAAEKAIGVKPMSEDPKYKDFRKNPEKRKT